MKMSPIDLDDPASARKLTNYVNREFKKLPIKPSGRMLIKGRKMKKVRPTSR